MGKLIAATWPRCVYVISAVYCICTLITHKAASMCACVCVCGVKDNCYMLPPPRVCVYVGEGGVLSIDREHFNCSPKN